MRFFLLAAVASLALVTSVYGAAASTITETVDFTATNFVAQNGHAIPKDPVKGSFTVTIDPTATYHSQTAGLTVNSIDVPYLGSIMFDYDPSFKALTIGANLSANTVAWGTNDFSLSVFLVDPHFQVPLFMYAQAGIDDIFITQDFAFSFSPSLTTTPIPASALMLLTALGALGGVGYLRGRKSPTPMMTLGA